MIGERRGLMGGRGPVLLVYIGNSPCVCACVDPELLSRTFEVSAWKDKYVYLDKCRVYFQCESRWRAPTADSVCERAAAGTLLQGLASLPQMSHHASCNLIRTSRVQQGLRGDVTATQHRRSLVVSRAVARTWMTTPYIASRPKAR